MVGVLLLVGLFRTSSALASAYGIAVATTMVVDGLLAFIVIWRRWEWPLWQTLLLIAPFVVVDVVFFSANFLKLFEGAWAPLLFGATMVLLILTWRRGTGILAGKTRRTEVPLDTLFRSLEKKPPPIVPGTAVFLTSDPEFAPTALLHNLKHNKILHQHNVVLTIITADTPRVSEEDRVRIKPLSQHFARVSLKFGYMLDSADDIIPAALHFLGLNPNSNDPKELERAAELLAKIRPLVRKFHSSEYLNALAGGEVCLVVGWSGDIKQAQKRATEAKKGVEIGYSIPKEGAQMFFDNLAIPKDAAHVAEAHAFIDYLLRPEVAAQNSNLVAYANGNLASQKFVDRTILDDKSVYPDASTMSRLYTVGARDQKSQRLINRLWTKIKTGR